MTDASKRRTLKGLAAVAAGTASAGLTSTAMAGCNYGNHQTSTATTDGHLAIHTRISAQTNDVEAVFLNAGNETLSIDALTPHEISTFRGKFDVAALTANKPLILAPGESVSVGMGAHSKELKFNDRMLHGHSLTRALQASASATSTNGKPIHISVNKSLPIV